jgi:hypothetical protein
MSRALLESLAGPRQTNFSRWLAANFGEPRIAWYPSAGTDLRDVLYLNEHYRNVSPPRGDEPLAPNLFLHTDYFVGDHSRFLDRPIVHIDDNTTIAVDTIEELPPLKLPLHNDLVAFGPSSATHRVVFFTVEVRSHRLGSFRAPILYVFSENAAFCSECLLQHEARISHVVQVRYGHGLGGGRSGPGWIRAQLARLRAEVYVTDSHHDVFNCQDLVVQYFPTLRSPDVDPSSWPIIRQMPQSHWDGYGPVTWYRVP